MAKTAKAAETAENISAQPGSTGEIIIYQNEDGSTRIDVRFADETVWLTQAQMAELYQTSRTNIVEHIGHIYEEALFKTVETDANGLANVSFELPDNLTTYRLMALAVTKKDLFGSGDSKLVVSKPLLAMPSLARFALSGDTVEA